MCQANATKPNEITAVIQVVSNKLKNTIEKAKECVNDCSKCSMDNKYDFDLISNASLASD